MNIEDYIKVDPVIIYPTCKISGKNQDCFSCDIGKNNLCKSPKGWCTRKYHGHSKGCPNYGKYPLCPPHNLMFDEVFDISKGIYLIYYAYDFKSHYNKMKERHPNWTDIQLRNPLYWQGTAKKHHKAKVKEFMDKYGHLGYEAITPECLGVDITKTLEKVGIILEWPPINVSYRIAFAGIPFPKMNLKNYKKVRSNELTNLN